MPDTGASGSGDSEQRDAEPESLKTHGASLSAPPPDGRQGTHGKSRAASLWVRDLLVSLVASLFIITFVYQPVKVEGTSMQPRLGNQDRLFINKFVYRFEKIERGDVVVFHYPLDLRKSYIKRVIALPGDQISIRDGNVYLNGKLQKEPYVPAKYRDHWSQPPMVVPPNDYFVMGDHRSISSDSRDWGPVPRKDIYGKASFVYWPADDIGLVH